MDMHNEHRFWESEISLWRDDLRAWQQELAKAQGEIKQLEKALEDHGQVLRTHGSTLRLEEQTFEGHEHAIAEYEKGGEGDELFEMARQHTQVAGHHVDHRRAHEQLKRRHHTVIAHWNLLLNALREPAESEAPPPKKPIVGVS
jgi:hypothetical protein